MATTIEKGSLVLVTGANSFIGSHCVDQLLAAGYNVRGTSRSVEKSKMIAEYADAKYGKGRFEAVSVPDMVHDGAFDEAVKGVKGILHVASVITFSDKPEEVIPPTVKGTLEVLKSASKEPGIKAFVYTSSSSACVNPQPNKKVVVTTDMWNEAAIHEANNNPEVDGYTVYAASKTAAEKALWQAVSTAKPPFQVAAVLPNANLGAILQSGAESSSSTGSWIPKLIKGDRSSLSFPPQWFVNVADTARLHVAALTDPGCNGKRLFAYAEPYTFRKIMETLKKQNPGKSFMDDIPDAGEDIMEIPNQEAEALLQKWYQKGFTGLDETVKENSKGLLTVLDAYVCFEPSLFTSAARKRGQLPLSCDTSSHIFTFKTHHKSQDLVPRWLHRHSGHHTRYHTHCNPEKVTRRASLSLHDVNARNESGDTSEAMDELLRSLLVPDHNGVLVPAYRQTRMEGTAATDSSNQTRPAMSENAPPPASASSPFIPRERNAGEMLDFGDAPPSLQSIEDWEKEHPYAGPKPKVVLLPAGPSNPGTVIAFYEWCTKLGLRPDFTLLEFAPYRFNGKVVVGEHVVELAGPFASKKEAKEQVCKAALPLLAELEQTHASRKRKGAETALAGDPDQLSKSDLVAEDWVSILMNYLQKCKLPYAEYDERRTESTPFSFACTVRFQNSRAEPFGTVDVFYSNKKDAKRAAARDAVLWLRTQGRLAGDLHSTSVKRYKQDGDSETEANPLHDGPKVEPQTGSAENGTKPMGDISLGQRVNETVASMGLIQPQFEVHNVDATLDSLIDMTVKFHERDVNSDPILGREISVKNVYGKKKAKEACCKEILQLLEEVKRSRAS
nr:aldehyde reductase 2 [Quercus suber]